MLVHIDKCDDPQRWYSNLVGRWWEVERDEGIEYKCRGSDGYINFILKKDCTLHWVQKKGH